MLSPTRSVRVANVAVPHVCIELRGYETIDAPGEEYGYHDVDQSATGPPVVHRRRAWWNAVSKVQPRFMDVQRTSSPDGEFAFVTPESEVVLALAIYAHGGDYPTAIRIFPRGHGGHGPSMREATARGIYTSESGRVEMNISLLAERMEAPELLWSSSARENDDSPCARMHAASGVAENPTMTRQQRNISPSPPLRTSYDKHTKDAQGLSFLQTHDEEHTPVADCDSLSSSTTPLACVEDRQGDYVISGVEKTVLTMLHFRSLCWNYGQRNAAFWEDNPAVCSIFRSISEESSATVDMATVGSGNWGTRAGKMTSQKRIRMDVVWNKLRWRQLSSFTDAWRWFPIFVVFGTVVLCFVLTLLRTSTHINASYDDDHVSTPATAGRSFKTHVSTPSSPVDPTSVGDEMIGTVYSSDGRVSQVALESTHQYATGTPLNTPRTSRCLNGKDAGYGTEKHQDEDVFSSMFRTLGGPTAYNVQQGSGDSRGTNCLGNVVVTQEG